MQHNQVKRPKYFLKGPPVDIDTWYSPLLKGILASQVLVAILPQPVKQKSWTTSDIKDALLFPGVDAS
jgi:hypothetical protein